MRGRFTLTPTLIRGRRAVPSSTRYETIPRILWAKPIVIVLASPLPKLRSSLSSLSRYKSKPTTTKPGYPLTIFGRILLAVAFALIQTGASAQTPKIYRVGLVSVGAPDTGVLGPVLAPTLPQRGAGVHGD